MIELGENRYGKSAIRVVKLAKRAERHIVRDLTVAVALEGAFEAAHVEGDNAPVIATDTMKNTVYAFAADRLDGSIEAFARALADHFAAATQVERATITIREHRWSPIPLDGEPAPDAFMRDPSVTRLAVVTVDGGGVTVEAGVEDLVVMKTAKSAFEGFPRDRFTTLPETSDRIMATQLSARWRYGPPDLDHDAVYDAVRRTLLDVFARHESASVQHSAFVIGRAMLEAHPEVEEVRLSLPNLHHWLVDLSPFGLDNAGEIFVATREPHGMIEASVRRGRSDPSPA
ncbi:MAG TPA: urate oxidase [Candidatus Limnocylindria bacterium]|nr:urate oxidase [Candidatus Limnocylindria bacterium]